jgi:hypothetical protein
MLKILVALLLGVMVLVASGTVIQTQPIQLNAVSGTGKGPARLVP